MMKIQAVQIDQIKFDTNNARVHDQKNLEAIQGSLEKFGQRKPIVIDHLGNIVAGNGTVEAAMLLGWTEIDAVTVPKKWDAETIQAFALADNRTAELATWNKEVMASQLLDLQEAGFEIQLLGFEAHEVPGFEPPEQLDSISPTPPKFCPSCGFDITKGKP